MSNITIDAEEYEIVEIIKKKKMKTLTGIMLYGGYYRNELLRQFKGDELNFRNTMDRLMRKNIIISVKRRWFINPLCPGSAIDEMLTFNSFDSRFKSFYFKDQV